MNLFLSFLTGITPRQKMLLEASVVVLYAAKFGWLSVPGLSFFWLCGVIDATRRIKR